jgi:hypothetical protein
VVRRAWSRLIRKQWLILYPLLVAVIDALAFLAIYAAEGDRMGWTAFFTANFDRWQYVHDHFFSGFSFTTTLGIAIVAGFASCLGSALIRAPYIRAIAGAHYPVAPRTWPEALNLFVFYVFTSLIGWVVLLPLPGRGLGTSAVGVVVELILILVIFADYVIVFEELGFVAALRRSVELVRHRWLAVLIIFIVYFLVALGLHSAYGHYYHGGGKVFILLPLSQILMEAFVTLVIDLLLIFLYEDIRRQSPA